MPNWCSNEIIISGKDKRKFIDFITKAENDNLGNTDKAGYFGKTWLGNLLLQVESMEEIEKLYKDMKLNYRGSIENILVSNDSYLISAESAWYTYADAFFYLKDKLKYDIDIKFYSEEDNLGYVMTNDTTMCDCKTSDEFPVYKVYRTDKKKIDDRLLVINNKNFITQEELVPILKDVYKNYKEDNVVDLIIKLGNDSRIHLVTVDKYVPSYK